VSTVGRAIAFSDRGVRMNLGLTVFQGDITDQREQFDLLIQKDRWFIIVSFPN
jgi:hypothetical protein